MTQSAHQFDKTITTTVSLRYLLHEPPDAATRDDWPLVLFLHGAGERGNDLAQVTVHGPPKHVEAGAQYPFYLASPQCPADARWRPEELTALLDDLVARLPVDRDRIYVTGLSMGGYGTFALAGQDPLRFAAILAVCGGGDRASARAIGERQLPVWVAHGDSDSVVPCSESDRMVEFIRQFGGSAEYRVYPGVDHDSWSQTYRDDAWWEWLLAHRR